MRNFNCSFWACVNQFKVALLVSSVIISGIGYVTFLLFDRSPPVIEAKLEIIPPVVIPGSSFHVDANIFYLRSCSVVVRRTLYDHNGMAYTSPEVDLPVSVIGLSHSATQVSLPIAFPDGEARLISKPKYSCNWAQSLLWPISVPTRVTKFIAKRAS